ncbi:hypothetical protein BD779DRAFT_1795470 [Infundibulicybe gibba]|nr:hypothetical protein BD779DRAFT_1795470 [Infundibulicybe gibba]
MTQNNWPSGVPSNTRPPLHTSQAPPHLHQQQFNQLWTNQMQQQSFPNGLLPNGMQSMNNVNIPFLHQQVIQDALRMSAPVEASDEGLLIQVLLDSRKKGETYKDALNSLHGRNGHAASLWKDYYLDHKHRIDEYISCCFVPPNAIPEPPSRSPSPPTIIIPHNGRGNKYTPEDRDFFLKFISWRLKCDSTLTRNDLCAQLAEKAPHHSAQSWASHWSNRHDLPDKILAAAQGEDYNSDPEMSSEEETVAIRPRPKYRDPSSDEEEEKTSQTHTQSSSDSDDSNDDMSLKSWDASEMGTKGGPFTDADLYITAKHVASLSNFHQLSNKEKWGPYSERFPQRSAKSWAECYRRFEKPIDKLVKKIRSRQHQPHPKRKYEHEDETNETSRSKRGREDGDVA